MSHRDDLWRDLAEASDELFDSMSAYTAAQTPEISTRVETAIREYTTRLAPVIGAVAAFEFQTSWQAVMDATDRLVRLQMSLSEQPSIDATDRELLHQLQSEQVAALSALTASEVALQARIDEAGRANGREKE
jgi:hypothetical protein